MLLSELQERETGGLWRVEPFDPRDSTSVHDSTLSTLGVSVLPSQSRGCSIGVDGHPVLSFPRKFPDEVAR